MNDSVNMEGCVEHDLQSLKLQLPGRGIRGKELELSVMCIASCAQEDHSDSCDEVAGAMGKRGSIGAQKWT